MSAERTPDIATGRLGPEEYAAQLRRPPPAARARIRPSSRPTAATSATTRPASRPARPSIDIPLFIREILTDNPKGAAETILSAEHPRRHVRPRLPDRDAVRGGLRARDGRGQAGADRRTPALRHRRPDGRPASSRSPRAAPTGKRVAVSAAARPGLSCAHRLAMHGHDVVIYEARQKIGGLNEYGIAAYKTPGDFAQAEVDFILSIGGIAVETGKALGRDITLDELAPLLRRGVHRPRPRRRECADLADEDCSTGVARRRRTTSPSSARRRISRACRSAAGWW